LVILVKLGCLYEIVSDIYVEMFEMIALSSVFIFRPRNDFI